MIKQSEFFEKYCVDKKGFDSTGIHWKDLESIYNDYENTRSDLEATATYIAHCLRQLNAVHSLRIRLKDAEHLIEKIIRKNIKDNSVDINQKNYKDKVIDLIGVRALHLFKDDWVLIHDFIVGHWDLHEPPTANVREGDPKDFIDNFKKRDCVINIHEFGYRSVHYIVKSQPSKEPHLAEIQVRTIFEEGFSEIDHQIRYPYNLENTILAYYLAIFNRLAGTSDEMGSFVKILKDELAKYAQNSKTLMDEKEELTRKLKEQLTKLKIGQAEREKLQEDLDKLSSIKSPIIELSTSPATYTIQGSPGLSNVFTGKLPEWTYPNTFFSLETPAVDEDPEPVIKSKRKQNKKPSKKDQT